MHLFFFNQIPSIGDLFFLVRFFAFSIFVTHPIIPQIGRENDISAELWLLQTVGDADPY